MDEKLEEIYPDFYSVNYDLRLLVADAPTRAERSFEFYNDYRDKYGSTDINVLKEAAESSISKNVFLNGFDREHFNYIAPYIKDTAEILCLFKCRFVKDLSVLSGFTNLKCLLVYGNNSIEELWDMKSNKELKAVSLVNTTNLRRVDGLLGADVEYLTVDSMDVGGNVKDCTIDDVEKT